MRKWGIVAIISFFCLSAAVIAMAQDDVRKQPACKYCGMDREKFAHTRAFVEYGDGTSEGTCSLHCLAVELALSIDKQPKTIWVGDMKTRNLIDVEKAIWVLGGKKQGVMTNRAKWAFEKKEHADEFLKENGGTPANFDQVIKAAYEDMYADTKVIRERRQARRMHHHK